MLIKLLAQKKHKNKNKKTATKLNYYCNRILTVGVADKWHQHHSHK